MALPALCSLMVLKIAVINVAGGALYGYTIGYVGPYSTLFQTSRNCTLYQSELACSTLQHTTCEWNGEVCAYQYDCSNKTQAVCEADDQCTFDEKTHRCIDAASLNSVQLGIFAGAPVVGGLFASLSAGLVLGVLGVRNSLLAYGALATVGSVMCHVSLPVNNYWVLVVGRLFVGAATGLICVACPLYCDAASPPEVRNQVGMLFQIATTTGIVIAALAGLLADPVSMKSTFTEDLHFDARLQAVNGLSTVFAVLLMASATTVPAAFGRKRRDSMEHESLVSDPRPSYTRREMVGPLAVAVVLSAAQQLTGINAIMSYAPIITTSIGLKPLLGNLLVMVWNFITSLGSVFVAARMQLRTMFLVGAGVGSLACLCTGIPVIPGVTTEAARTALAGVGVFLFILMFEVFMGSAYFVLAQQLFPLEFREKGSSWTLGVQFTFAITINVCFPIAQTRLSGGPGADQNLGLGIIFIFFGVVGSISTAILFKFLRVFEAPKDAPMEAM